MQFLHKMHDYQLDLPYDLYKVNAKELSERLHKNYNLDKLTLHTFNSDTELGRYLMDVEEAKLKGREYKEDSYTLEKIKEIKEKIETNTHVSTMTKIGVSFGYELMPVAVSSYGDFTHPNTKIELIDGFKRMFAIDEVPSIDILVKVYGKINDTQWINSMIIYNSWKWINGGSSKYMDRGFQLGMHYRYDLRFLDLILPEWNMFRSLDMYASGTDLRAYYAERTSAEGTYMTLWNNGCFADDVKAIYEILSQTPTFRLKKRGKPDQLYDTSDPKLRGRGLGRVLEVFVSLLGEIRRYEFNEGLKERKPFDRTILYNYMADDANQKHLVKIINMSVDGFVLNYIADHMREEIKKRMYQGMGYPFVPKVKEAKMKLPNISIEEIEM